MMLNFFVVDNGGPGILGSDWLDTFGVGFEMMNSIHR